MLTYAAAGSPAPSRWSHGDLAFLQYTGGTTGVAKGAMLSHGNMVANVLQSHGLVPAGDPSARGTYYIALPLYHIFSLTANCLLHMRAGGTGIMVPNPRDFPAFVKLLQKYPPVCFCGVNTLFNALMNTPGFERIDFSKLVAAVGGGMAVQAAVAENWLEAHRQSTRPRLGPHRNFACGCGMQAARHGVQRRRWPARFLHRSHGARR